MNEPFFVRALAVLIVSFVLVGCDDTDEPVSRQPSSSKPFSGSLPPEEVGVIPEEESSQVAAPLESGREPPPGPDTTPAQTLPPPP